MKSLGIKRGGIFSFLGSVLVLYSAKAEKIL